MDNYFAKYVRGFANNKEQAAKLFNSDNIVGDLFQIKTNIKDGKHTSSIYNKFGESPVFFNEEISREIEILKSKNMNIVGILSLVGFSEDKSEERESNYWAEFLIIAYPKNYSEEFNNFVNNASKKLSNGTRPDVSLNKQEVEKVISTKGQWFPSKTKKMPKKEKGTVFLRTRKTFKDRIIEQGRKKNIGCYIVSWVFLLLFVTFLIYFISRIVGISG